MEETNINNTPYQHCLMCPRQCGANRTTMQYGANPVRRGKCGESDQMRIAWAGLHTGEEPVITVAGGSGTIFFSGCALRCSFCQNYQISQGDMGRAVDRDEFVRICLTLQDKGAENINLVTGSHHVPLIANYMRETIRQGLTLPIVWNTSSYETVDTLRELSDVVDIWLADLKTVFSGVAEQLFKAPDYPSIAKTAISWMVDNTPLRVHRVHLGNKVYAKMTRGVIVRHLALPTFIADTMTTLNWIKETLDPRVIVSLMYQYTPTQQVLMSADPALNRVLNSIDIEALDGLIDIFNFGYLFKQEAGSEDELLLPNFEDTYAFPPDLATPVWHWKEGFVVPPHSS